MNPNRPLSWSSISSFEYSPEEWYRRYILGEKSIDTREMEFGKLIANSFSTDKPLAPVKLYEIVEYPLTVVFNGIPLMGYVDTYDPKTHNFREFKTGKKIWDQKRANEHGQLKMYALLLFIMHKVKPENYKIHLDWIPTQDNGDFSISFVEPIKVYTFEVKLTMKDIVIFGAYIKDTYKRMQEFAKSYPLALK